MADHGRKAGLGEQPAGDIHIDVDEGVQAFGPGVSQRLDGMAVDEQAQVKDIGPETVKLFRNSLKDARTIIWNGPMGVFEYKPFETGTFEIARELAELTASGTKTIVSGGDTGAVIARLRLENKFTHISTGGGATLEFLEGKNLPGIEVLPDKPKVQAV